MYLHGDISYLFEFLVLAGFVDESLDRDWYVIQQSKKQESKEYGSFLEDLNICLGSKEDLMSFLDSCPNEMIQYLIYDIGQEMALSKETGVLH